MRRPDESRSLQGGIFALRSGSSWRRLRTHILLLGGFASGTVSGICVQLFSPGHPLVPELLQWVVRPVEQIFLGTLFVLIVPLLFSAIVSGASRMRTSSGMPGLLASAFSYMLAISASAALIGMAMANLFRPGDWIPTGIGNQLLSVHLPQVPYSVRSLAPGSGSANSALMLMVMLSLAIGVVLPLIRKHNRQLLLSACERTFALGMIVLSLVTRFAPLAVACFMFDITVIFGWHLLIYLSAYIFVVIAALALQVGVTFLIVVWMRGDVAPSVFLRNVHEAALIAFSTSSSNATLPTALKVAETDLLLPNRIARPVLGIGTVCNQGGTTIYVTVTVLFVSQFFGMDLALDKQAVLFAIAILAGMGTVGVPAGGLPAAATILALLGLPPEGIGLVIGVDRLLDMFRTLVNVVGDLAIAVALARDPLSARASPLAGTENT